MWDLWVHSRFWVWGFIDEDSGLKKPFDDGKKDKGKHVEPDWPTKLQPLEGMYLSVPELFQILWIMYHWTCCYGDWIHTHPDRHTQGQTHTQTYTHTPTHTLTRTHTPTHMSILNGIENQCLTFSMPPLNLTHASVNEESTQ